jgi:signal transduction histidine kinase
LDIRDNGKGIEPKHLPHLFEPFFTTKLIGKGTGMGMSISYQIVVEKHSGILEYRSDLGVGTEFIILIPVQQQIDEMTLSS